MHAKLPFGLGLALGLVLLPSGVAFASDPTNPFDSPPAPIAHPEEREGRFELGFRMGGGAPYHLASADPNSKMVVSFALGASVGVRAAKAVSLAVEPTMLLQSTLASTSMAIVSEPGTKAPVGTPSTIAALSPTVGLHPTRAVALIFGPTIAAGPVVMGGGTARLALHLPVGQKGVRLAPAVETWALTGSGVSMGTLVGSFGVEL